MAYADRDNSGTRVVAAVLVSILMATLGYAFVTGLAYKYVKKAAEQLNTFDVAPPPPPPPPDEPPPPPPPDQPQTPPPVVSPPPIVQNPNPPPVQIQTVTTPPPRINLTPIAAPPAPPAPPAAPPKPSLGARAKLRTNPGDVFTPDYYPAEAKRLNVQGRVGISLVVGGNGRVSSCRVTGSSGSGQLDDTTCRIATRSLRFDPAKDTDGNPIESTWPMTIRWELKDE